MRTPVRDDALSGTPGTGGYGLGWSTAAFDWADEPQLTHKGSNSMNLARLVVETEQDLGVVVKQHFYQQYVRH